MVSPKVEQQCVKLNKISKDNLEFSITLRRPAPSSPRPFVLYYWRGDVRVQSFLNSHRCSIIKGKGGAPTQSYDHIMGTPLSLYMTIQAEPL